MRRTADAAFARTRRNGARENPIGKANNQFPAPPKKSNVHNLTDTGAAAFYAGDGGCDLKGSILGCCFLLKHRWLSPCHSLFRHADAARGRCPSFTDAHDRLCRRSRSVSRTLSPSRRPAGGVSGRTGGNAGSEKCDRGDHRLSFELQRQLPWLVSHQYRKRRIAGPSASRGGRPVGRGGPRLRGLRRQHDQPHVRPVTGIGFDLEAGR